ncbi:MAG: ATPase, T2SS/T4P/T4SS family, partial [Pirellulaceae bacterium]|nr:ATPase, T2SS/T4P/T4SS family [Pirellulaceae bacterium]
MTTVSESVFQPDTFQPETLFDLDSEHAVDALIRRAVELRASDLFFMTEERAVAIAVRRFGVVTPISRVSREQGRRLISHIKALAGMNIAEARRPLDGRWIWGAGEEQVELRVNCIATLFGSDLTMRLWSRETGLIPLDELGLAASDLRKVNSMLQRPSGLILVTGPTGAGKTTTLYACLETLRDGSRKINTLEDPVEFAIPGIRQSQVRADLGVDY